MAMYTYLQQALPRVVIHRTQVVGEGEPRASNEDFKDGFSPEVFRSRLEQKIPVIDIYFVAFEFCFLWRNLC